MLCHVGLKHFKCWKVRDKKAKIKKLDTGVERWNDKIHSKILGLEDRRQIERVRVGGRDANGSKIPRYPWGPDPNGLFFYFFFIIF